MPNERVKEARAGGQRPQHGRADYQKRAYREATLQLSSIVVRVPSSFDRQL
jgi:hypothetical protein